MSMSDGSLDPGSWATEPKAQMLLNAIKPVRRNAQGQYADLDKRDPTQLASGGSAELETLGNDFLVYFADAFPWLSMSKEGDVVHVRYSNEKVDDTFENYAFLGNDGQAKSGFSVGAVFAQSSGNALYSSPESADPEEISLTNAINYAEARGANADVMTWDQKNYITGLFPLLFKTLDGQSQMHGNNSGGGSRSQNTILSFTNDYGMNGTTTNQTSKMAFLWIHDFWGNAYWWVGGAKTNRSRYLMVQHGARSSTSDGDFDNTGIRPSANLNDAINKMYLSNTEVGFFPSNDSGSYSTYYCDRGVVHASSTSSYCLYVGGQYSLASGYAGPFYVNGGVDFVTFAARLSFKEGYTA